ncbi:type II toxin-antitoxin system RelE/ParE family toxin [Cyanobium sp. BA20m-p-22]|uniref:type II toxin-antitoxin system RelE family toxin n=1 Tax=Cyanobium sp. BA20m-p-22 TaxID=2823704 RepID=UPI0020CC28EE|nr:type II toxin-antitoxin system RelE/ParE family toxin [Cyanobium sp. BA20m-p-22]MCP9911785.1 type II toxin-antitoxin system RelE/ParE family toxin [Cyanobium sp. BA20m-p-22]
MAWRIEFTPAAAKELRKLDRQISRRIGAFLKDLVASCGDPRQRGNGLTANWAGLWRYRVGDHRVICQLEDDRLLVLVVRIAHRSEAYG